MLELETSPPSRTKKIILWHKRVVSVTSPSTMLIRYVIWSDYKVTKETAEDANNQSRFTGLPRGPKFAPNF